MAILDPIKTVKATVTNNYIGTLAGGLAGYYFLRNRLPVKGTYGTILSIVGGALVGAYASKMLTAKKGALASASQIKK